MRLRAGITVFSALTFWLAASFLFALLEAGRVFYLEAYVDMSAELALESVCAEYQPGMWEEYHLLGLDGAYGGEDFSIDYVTAVLRERLHRNLEGENTGGAISELRLAAASPTGYCLLTDGDGAVFLSCVADYMKTGFPMEAVQILYDRYIRGISVEEEGRLEESVESAQNAIDEARRQQEAAAEQEQDELYASAGDLQVSQEQNVAAEPVENPLEVVLAWKRNALLGMVTQDVRELSVRSISMKDSVGKRNCLKGTMQVDPEISWFDKILALEYAGTYFSDYCNPQDGRALSYELEYLLCNKASDQENLEGAVERLLLFREAANVTHILSDSGKRNEAFAIANILAGFTGNPLIIRAVQIGVIAAWAYVESVLDIRALLDGDRIALVKRGDQWTSSLDGLSDLFGKDKKAADCGDGFSYQEYIKGFLFLLDEKELSARMMDLMEKNLRLVPAYKNLRMDHVICRVAYDMEFEAEPLFWRFVVLSSPALPEHRFFGKKEFSYYR